MEVNGDGIGEIDAGVIGDRGDDIDAGDNGELQDVSPDIKHRTWSCERDSSLLSDSRSFSFS